MHSSLTFLVSGQAQQIFFFGFESAGTVAGADFSSFGSCDEDVAVKVLSFDVVEVLSVDNPLPILKEDWNRQMIDDGYQISITHTSANRKTKDIHIPKCFNRTSLLKDKTYNEGSYLLFV